MRNRLSHRGAADLQRYAEGIQAMRKAGTYHKYVYWHATFGMRMDENDPVGQDGPIYQRGLAHRGPSFLPWHREFIWRFERDLRQALDIDSFGLPYWDWATDRDHLELETSRIWEYLGANSGAVRIGGKEWTRMWAELDPWSGYKRFKPIDFNAPVIRNYNDTYVEGQVPTTKALLALITDPRATYDSAPWNGSIYVPGFRNSLERGGHDTIHVLVGGTIGDQLSPFTSVNDPTFFLHHAMVDRVWSRWQDVQLRDWGIPLDEQYVPQMGQAPEIHQIGHRIDEPMLPWSDATEMHRWGLEPEDVTPRMVLDHRGPRLNYRYDHPRRGLGLVTQTVRGWITAKDL